MLEDILSQVQKPGRYIGAEWNVSRKDFGAAQVKFALCFPDLYEIGMSNLGLRIIYGLLNSLPQVCCERFFACASDMESVLRDKGLEIFSLESRKGLREFDLVGFSLGYELSYTNVLNMLELGGIPLEAASRGADYPLVIGGGPCALNPEPMHAFFDLFVIGEAEEAILELIGAYRKHGGKFKSGAISKQDLLVLLSGIPGVYAPSLYEVNYSQQGRIEGFRPKFADVPARVKKRFVGDFDKAYFPVQWLVPYIQVTHDRIAVEIMRGCPNQCRFCQARTQYFPLRLRKKENVLDLAFQAYRSSGYEEISLCGLSVSDYPGIEELAAQMVGAFKEKAVSISLPSLKSRPNISGLSTIIAKIKKTGLTFAPEASSERLRRFLNKNFKLDDFLKVLEEAYALGYQNIKLYFMVGIPFEEESDLSGIGDFANNVSLLRKKAGRGCAGVNISVSTLIPKPHTPLQWFGMPALAVIKEKQELVRKNLRNRRIRAAFHNPFMSFLEGALSRGDRRLSKVILAAFKKGAKFDSWDEHFVFEKWTDAFAQCGLDPDFYLQPRQKDEFLPWDFLETGVSRDSLAAEYDKLIEMK